MPRVCTEYRGLADFKHYVSLRMSLLWHGNRYCYALAHREGGNKRWFCPSVRLSVRPSILWCDWHTSLKVKRSKITVTRPINADTHPAAYLLNGKACELQTWYTDGGRRLASARGAMTSKDKVARSCDQSEPYWPNAVPVSLEADGGIPCQPNPAATLLVICHLYLERCS